MEHEKLLLVRNRYARAVDGCVRDDAVPTTEQILSGCKPDGGGAWVFFHTGSCGQFPETPYVFGANILGSHPIGRSVVERGVIPGGKVKLRTGELTWRTIDEDLVILDLRTSTYLTTNASGAVLMKELAEERSEDELTASLIQSFGISTARAQSDVRNFIQALDASGLLEETA